MERELKKILYVEDEADIRLIVQIALVDLAGFTLKACANGYEALAEVESFNPDLILLDVMMPGLDGPATLKELRKLPTVKAIPIIFMTARIQEKELSHYREIGIQDIISKPFEPLTLADTLRAFWSQYNE
jgi:two-component system, OmpR family, response regulator